MNHEQGRPVSPEGGAPRETISIISSYGVEMKVFMNNEDTLLETDDREFTIPQGTPVAKLAFVPFTREYSESHPTQTIASGIMGMNNIIRFFELANDQNLPIMQPEYLVGYTSKDLARFAKRFGFHTRAEEGDQVYRVVGQFDEVKESLTSFITKDSGSRAKAIFERARRENPDFWERAVHQSRPQVSVAEFELATEEEMEQLIRILRSESRRQESFLKAITVGTGSILAANLGLSIENIVQGNYIAGGIGAGFSLGSAAVIGSMEYKRRKRIKER